MTAGVPSADWERLLAIRSEVNAAIEAQRKAKVLGNSLMAAVRLTASGTDLALLRAYADQLRVAPHRVAGRRWSRDRADPRWPWRSRARPA